MFVTDWFYCNQYQELVNTGRNGDKALENGLMLSSACLTLNVMTVFAILLKTSQGFFDLVDSMTEQHEGKLIGAGIAALLIVVFYFLLKSTKGSEPYFNRVIARYQAMPEAEQKAISRKPYSYLFGSLILLVVCTFV